MNNVNGSDHGYSNFELDADAESTYIPSKSQCKLHVEGRGNGDGVIVVTPPKGPPELSRLQLSVADDHVVERSGESPPSAPEASLVLGAVYPARSP